MTPWEVLHDHALSAASSAAFGVASLNVFYSNPAVALRPGALYLVGLNPGGDPKTHDSQTESEPLGHPRRAAERPDWNKYVDEDWGPSHGRNLLQQRIASLADAVLPGGPEGLRTAFCTNALFMRGNLTKANGGALWSACRPWHIEWLRVVQPPAILCFGNGEAVSPYSWFRSLMEGRRERGYVPCYAGFGAKASDGLINGKLTRLVGVPHLSRWSPSTARSELAVEMVRSTLAEALTEG